jgi:transposase
MNVKEKSARRKFEHSKDNDRTRSEEALAMIGRLYDIEHEARNKELTYDELKGLRQEQSVVIIGEIAQWLTRQGDINHVVQKLNNINMIFH